MTSTNKLDYMDLIINYLNNRRMGAREREYMGFIFEAYNLSVEKI